MNEDFAIVPGGLKSGVQSFEWHADKKFFRDFENSGIPDAGLDIRAEVLKSGALLKIDGAIKGKVVTLCDRCLGPLEIPVSVGIALDVAFGGAKVPSVEGRELIELGEGEDTLDFAQVVYDYVMTSLPIVRTHPEGECDPEVVKYLSQTGEDTPESSPESPFKSLKTLLDKK